MTHADVAVAPAGREAGPARRTRSLVPTLRLERSLLRDGYPHVIGMDEVGRGALAGPVSVGAVLVEATTRSAPVGLRDSKLLSPVARETLAPRLRRWARRWAVGHASPTEIDEIGIIAALRLAGRRALCQLDVDPGMVILDGNHDWLSTPALAVDAAQVALPLGAVVPVPRPDPRVRTLVKADLRCAAVAAASVLAKTTRDAMMVDLARTHPLYRWELNKGYSAPEHLVALGAHGACPQHRLSWRLPGLGGLHPLQTMIPMADDDGQVWAEADAELDVADAELALADAELALRNGGLDESAMAAGPPTDGGWR